MLRKMFNNFRFYVLRQQHLIELEVPGLFGLPQDIRPLAQRAYSSVASNVLLKWLNENLSGPYTIEPRYSHIHVKVLLPIDYTLLKLANPLETLI